MSLKNEGRLVQWGFTLVASVLVLGLADILGVGSASQSPGTQSADLNLDGAVDLRDFAEFQIQMSGPIPAWLQEIIDGFEAGGVLYSAHYVWQYQYNGELVYYIPPRCCDIMSVLYNVYGERLCHPSGGFTGNGDGQCPDFFDERTDEVLIWEDPRG